MAVMTSQDRVAVWASFMRQEQMNATLQVGVNGLTKVQLQAAVDAADQWVSDNAASFNSALPVAARSALTASQKSALLMYILIRRFQVGA